MDYFEQKFRDRLPADLQNDGLEIEIAGVKFQAAEVLKKMDENAFDDVLTEWKSSREAEMIAIADQQLDLFECKDRFALLQEAFNRGSVIPFIGAGMSMTSDYPGWTAFLYDMLNNTDVDRDKFNNFINSGNYEEAAQLISDSMPNGRFDQQIREVFARERPSQGPVKLLPYYFEAAAITTNFDDLIDRVYSEAQLPFSRTLPGNSAEELPIHLGTNRRVLVHLHGTAHSRVGRVLTLTEYQRAYNNDEAVQHVIEQLCYRTLLFTGCSLTHDRTLDAMAECLRRKANHGLPSHYAFIQLSDGIDRIAEENRLAQSNIYPIWYDGEHDECIEAFLIKLGGMK